jgi:MFS family permease
VVVALFGGFGSSCIINQNLLMSRLGRHLGKGEVFGILMGVMTITSSLSPALLGLLIDNFGFKPAIMFFTLPLVLSVVLLLVLLRSDLPGKAMPAESAAAGV